MVKSFSHPLLVLNSRNLTTSALKAKMSPHCQHLRSRGGGVAKHTGWRGRDHWELVLEGQDWVSVVMIFVFKGRVSFCSPRLAWNSWQTSCLSLSSARIVDMSYHVPISFVLFVVSEMKSHYITLAGLELLDPCNALPRSPKQLVPQTRNT